MVIKRFEFSDFEECRSLRGAAGKFSGGSVVIVGGSKLFHGAPIMSLRPASRIVSMVYFASGAENKEVADYIKANLSNFVWIPRDDLDGYVQKAEAVLIGPGLMRSHIREHKDVCDSEGQYTRDLSLRLFKKYPNKKWIVDGGSLQVLKVEELPKGAAITPNRKEFEMLFGESLKEDREERWVQVTGLSRRYGLVILVKDEVSMVTDGEQMIEIYGGNDGLTKGGVGDVLAGTALGLAAKDGLVFALAAASYLVKKAGERLAERVGYMFNSDDLGDEVPRVWGFVQKKLIF